MSKVKFGTDGWRAVIAKDYTFENLEAVAQATADYLKKKKKTKKILKVAVGYDARFLSKEFAERTSEVLCGNRIKVFLSNQKVPTPAVSFYVKNNNCDLGIMITASHNPCIFNGFKIKTSDGGAAGKGLTSAVEKELFKHKVKAFSLEDAKSKKLLHLEDLSLGYLKFIRGYLDFSLLKKLKLHILVDLMYGSGNKYIEAVLKNTPVKVSYLHDEFNPSFGGLRPEPTEDNLKGLITSMKTGKYDLGIALDGDGDRIACVLKGGRYINAQLLLPLLALHLAQNRKFTGGIVKTIVGSNVIDSVALYLNRFLFETPVGFKYISDLFESHDILIGGEEAGGIGVKKYIPERDGTMAGLLLLEMISASKKKPESLVKDFEKKFGQWHYSRTAVPVGKIDKMSLERIKIPKQLLNTKVQRVNRLDGIKIIADSCWLMFRASGTEPIVRIYSEAKTKKKAGQLISKGRKMLDDL